MEDLFVVENQKKSKCVIPRYDVKLLLTQEKTNVIKLSMICGDDILK